MNRPWVLLSVKLTKTAQSNLCKVQWFACEHQTRETLILDSGSLSNTISVRLLCVWERERERERERQSTLSLVEWSRNLVFLVLESKGKKTIVWEKKKKEIWQPWALSFGSGGRMWNRSQRVWKRRRRERRERKGRRGVLVVRGRVQDQAGWARLSSSWLLATTALPTISFTTAMKSSTTGNLFIIFSTNLDSRRGSTGSSLLSSFLLCRRRRDPWAMVVVAQRRSLPHWTRTRELNAVQTCLCAAQSLLCGHTSTCCCMLLLEALPFGSMVLVSVRLVFFSFLCLSSSSSMIYQSSLLYSHFDNVL